MSASRAGWVGSGVRLGAGEGVRLNEVGVGEVDGGGAGVLWVAMGPCVALGAKTMPNERLRSWTDTIKAAAASAIPSANPMIPGMIQVFDRVVWLGILIAWVLG
jgi:hypothetical protein